MPKLWDEQDLGMCEQQKESEGDWGRMSRENGEGNVKRAGSPTALKAMVRTSYLIL